MAEQTPNHNSILKDTREAKGLTLEIVHEATKIPLDALKAIEQGYSVRVLTPFYYRGFIKIYAEFLGLDVKEVFRAFNIDKPLGPVVTQSTAEKPAAPPKGTLPRSQPKAKQPQLVKTNVVWENIREALGRIFSPRNRGTLLRVAGIVVVLFVLAKIGGCVAGHFKKAPAKHTIAKAKERRTAPAPVEQAAAPAESAPAQSIAAHSSSRRVDLVVRAMRDTWIQVKADGKVVFAMTMQKGTMETWSAREQIELSGRNINELELEVNGRPLGSLGSSERRARHIIITRDGLTVKR